MLLRLLTAYEFRWPSFFSHQNYVACWLVDWRELYPLLLVELMHECTIIVAVTVLFFHK